MRKVPKVFSYKSKIEISTLKAEKRIDFILKFSDNDIAELKKDLDLISLKKVNMSGKIISTAADEWRLDAQIGASIVQESVLSLKSVNTRVDNKFQRKIIKGRDEKIQKNELELNEDDFIENNLNLGAIFFESLALAIPIFPKTKNEKFESKLFSSKGVDPLTDDKISPFSILTKLQ